MSNQTVTKVVIKWHCGLLFFDEYHLKRLKRYKYERYAILCQLAYSAKTEYELDFSNYQQAEFFDSSKRSCVRVVWQQQKKEVVVVFRGSHSVRDWLLNLCVLPRKVKQEHSRYWVHWGVYNLLKQPCYQVDPKKVMKLDRALLKLLSPLVAEGKKVTFIGHSTGGAMAVLFADWFERIYTGKTKRVVTFGQPSLGGWSFAKSYALPNKTYRICCDIDMVTFLPPLPYVYFHVGKMLWLHNDVIYDNIPPWKRLLLTLRAWIIGPISNHFMHKYIRHKGLFDEH